MSEKKFRDVIEGARDMLDPKDVDVFLYHRNCSDGFGGAYCAWHYRYKQCKYLAITFTDFGNNEYMDKIYKEVYKKNVVVCDIVFTGQLFDYLDTITNNIIYLDHHETAVDELGDCGNLFFTREHSGCIMAWHYFFGMKSKPPLFLRYIEDKDTWKWDLKDSKEFNASFTKIRFNFYTYDRFRRESVRLVAKTIEEGKEIMKYENFYVKSAIKNCSDPMRIGPYNVAICNSSFLQAEIGSSLARLEGIDYAMVWYHSNKGSYIKVSLVSNRDDVNVYEIARMFGGGGHRKAAGFHYHTSDIFYLIRILCTGYTLMSGTNDPQMSTNGIDEYNNFNDMYAPIPYEVPPTLTPSEFMMYQGYPSYVNLSPQEVMSNGWTWDQQQYNIPLAYNGEVTPNLEVVTVNNNQNEVGYDVTLDKTVDSNVEQ